MLTVFFQVEQLREQKLEIDQQLRSAVRTQYQHSGMQTFEVKTNDGGTSVVDLDPYWIRIQELSGSGSVFPLRISIHSPHMQ